MKKVIFMICISLVLIVGCNKPNVTTWTEAQGIANDMVENDENADIFMFKDRVYELYSSDVHDTSIEKIGEIQNVYSPGDTFQNGTATKLPIDAKIYSTSIESNSDFLLVKIDGKWFEYKSVPQG
ncbi:MAG TPA: hypothetical protein VKZ77_09390 [Bacillaceae bacterium]|nr:hypothetical protein [Paenibacillus bovis]HLU22689.1 hypothetical protein [Bacillaceae bacterium]